MQTKPKRYPPGFENEKVFHPSFTGMEVPEDTTNPRTPTRKDSAPRFVIGCSDEDFDDALEENEVLHVVPPDGGWGWVVVGASFLCNAVVDGIIFTSGMLFPKLRETFGASNSEVAWISSLLGGFYLLVGPFVSGLANAFGFRVVCILGALVAASACGLSYFATNIYFLYVTFGILGGMGFGMIYVPAVIATGFYFEKRRALATGIAVCGSGIGTFIMSPINNYVLTTLEDRWKVIFLVYAGIVLSCVLFGLAFRPLTTATGKSRKATDFDFDVPGTPLLIRIKRARDHELAQCPSALSMNSSYSRSASKVTLEEQQHAMNGDLKPPTPLARALLERHGGGASKRFSYPGIAVTGPEPILEESEVPGADEENEMKTEDETKKGDTETPIIVDDAKKSTSPTTDDFHLENGDATKERQLLLDNNKNETPRSQSPNAVVKETSLTFNTATPNRKCPRNMSAPALTLQPPSVYLEQRRRSSRGNVRTEVTRPFYRDDIFYSGSLARIPQYKSSETIGQYIASVTHLPPVDAFLPDGEDRSQCCSCAESIRPVLQRIFDFSLLSSITFIVLAVSGFLALLALFVPFNFLPSYATDVGLASADTSFLMSLIGICNTVGRIIAGWVSDHPKVDALLVNNLALIIGGAGTVILPFVSDLSLMYCYAVVFGLSVAAFASLRSILLVELLGLEKLTNAFGLLLLFQGLAATFGSPIAGAFVDMTQEYKISFYVFGGIFALAGVLCIPLRLIKRWEDDRIDRKLRKAKYGVE